MGEYTQANRLIRIETVLGKDALLLQGFRGQEGVSRLFHFDLYMHSENRSIPMEAIVGKKATIVVVLPDKKERYVNGIISSFSQAGSTPLEMGTTPRIFAHYTATLVPWMWMLTRTSDCRIFQDMTVPDIITKIFQEHKLDFNNQLHGKFKRREYSVQYRETDFNFVSRLMEEEGIFYFFRHEADKHTLVVANDPSEFKKVPNTGDISYKSVIGEQRHEDVITEWTVGQEVRPGRYAINDFNFKKPLLDLTSDVSGKDERKLEIYDYPGEYATRDEGERLVGIRMHEQEARQVTGVGSSTCRGFIAGFRFKLKDHYRKDFNKEYVIASNYISSDQGTNYRTTGVDAAEFFQYSNQIQCIPFPAPFRPARSTPVPFMQGPQTAIVVGPPGEEIYVDQYGRVKVQFHWDREGKYNEKSSCWIRVSQNWAGKRWGAIFTPRVGQEVIVDFLEGDPDQPIITGRVYNGNAMPPYELPAEKTKSTIKSDSSKGGGGFNEIRFEDKKGAEQVFMHAQKDFDLRVREDAREFIGNDRHLIVKGDQKELVEADKHLQVRGDHHETVLGTYSHNVMMDRQEKVLMRYALDAGVEIHQKAGLNFVIESETSITLKVGTNFINISPAGIFIIGTVVVINSTGSFQATPGAGSTPEIPANPGEADGAEAGQKAELPPPKKPPVPNSYSVGALSLQKAAQDGTPFTAVN
ncbi:MAG TPA: type VI secretion system tip protein VgrG [Blastocatellia bacterium]|nr:type VI secretion system tip protein VgrG [Blastocatellia bacterium]